MTIEEISQKELEKLKDSNSENESSNILFNIIKINYETGVSNDHYRNIKRFFDSYIKSLKLSDYGYDNFNYDKIASLLKTLKPEEQLSILQFIISETSKELPQYDKNWFIIRKHKAEIKRIITNKRYPQYPKAILLYFGQSTKRLILFFTIIFTLVSIILLPAPIDLFKIFEIEFKNYSTFTAWNHILNVFALFAHIEHSVNIKPLNWAGIFILIIGKIGFWILIINFIYLKIMDEILKQ